MLNCSNCFRKIYVWSLSAGGFDQIEVSLSLSSFLANAANAHEVSSDLSLRDLHQQNKKGIFVSRSRCSRVNYCEGHL